ncbi:D-glycerate dehydrogenase [Actinocorallia longicatena]|uniref:D-glycerate dehydrogenase n=1 Tax=Actinocorallia longicatena TaxID=111803 RepID=A0ABP6Q9V5_9ACTN
MTGAKLVPAEALDLIESRGYTVRHLAENKLTDGELDKALHDVAGYLIGGEEELTAEHLSDHAATLRAIAFVGTDFRAFVPGWQRAFDLGIPLINCPGANATSVAEYTALLLLMMARPIADQPLTADGSVPPAPAQGMELAGRTLGIVGLGRIGSRVASIAAGFGMNVVYSGRHEVPGSPLRYVDQSELFRTSDVVSLHRPGLAHGEPAIVGAHELGLMRPGGILINAGHYDLVDPVALAEAISGKGVRAAFDGIGAGREWRELLRYPHDRFLALPQMGYLTSDANRRAGLMAATAVCDVLDGGTSPLVNNPGHQASAARSASSTRGT